jgi:hypothetical protein
MTTPLSPAAQAVLAAIHAAPDNTRDSYRSAGVAALRAAADRVVPKTPTLSYPEDYELGVWVANDDTRTEFLAIAAELEAHQ